MFAPRRRTAATVVAALFATVSAAALVAQSGAAWSSADAIAIKRAGDVQISPDGRRVAFTVLSSQRSGRSTSQIWIHDVARGTTARLGGDRDAGSNPRWSPDSQSVAFTGRIDDESGLGVQRMDDSPPLFLTRVVASNHPLAVDRRALHVVAGQLAHRVRDGHAGPGSRRRQRRPDGDHAVPLQARGVGGHDALQRQPAPAHLRGRPGQSRSAAADAGHVLRALDRLVAEGRRDPLRLEPRGRSRSGLQLRRLRGEHRPRQTSGGSPRPRAPSTSPPGRRTARSIAMLATKRARTSSETTMEDTHVWVMKADGTDRRELGAAIDNRQGPPNGRPTAGGSTSRCRNAAIRGSTASRRPAPAGPRPSCRRPVSADRSARGRWRRAARWHSRCPHPTRRRRSTSRTGTPRRGRSPASTATSCSRGLWRRSRRSPSRAPTTGRSRRS